MSKTFTYSDVAEHNTKKDCYIVVHDKVYDASKFIDEHPGGEEVMLDVAGQDSTEAFEDVGHSDEAREILDGLLVGDLKRGENDPKPKTKTQVTPSANGSSGGGSGLGLYVMILLGGIVAYGAYQYLEGQKQKQ